jgi:pyruvate dehydrogenase E1 component alpha subunit/2-oxoisovalerate dehydrogenase E1 component alpha subunit
MLTARVAEERLELLQKQGKVAGSIYLSLGQEAGVGAAYALRRSREGVGDFVAPSLRGCAALLLFGGSLVDYYRHHLGRATGPSRGRESGVYWGDHDKGILAPVAPLGTMIEVMAGITLSFALRGEDRVGMVFSGDGATSTGAWHEGLSFAAAQRCPMVLVVENNQWAFSTPTEKSSRLESFIEKAPGYGVDAETVDGTDVEAVHAAAVRAVAQARAGGGPVILELRYFRRRGHAQHDAQEYVDAEDVAQWEARDPLLRAEQNLLDRGWASSEALAAVLEEAEARAASAVAEALGDPEPAGAEALHGAYTDLPATVPWTRRSPAEPRHPW